MARKAVPTAEDAESAERAMGITPCRRSFLCAALLGALGVLGGLFSPLSAVDVEALGADGVWLKGAATAADGKLTVGGKAIPLEQLVIARRQAALSTAIDQAVVLADGSVIAGVVVSLQADQLKLASDQLGELSIPAKQVAAIVLTAQALATLSAEGAPGAVLANGDLLPGSTAFINDQAVGINTGKKIVDIARERIALVRLAATRAPAAGPQQYLRLAGGDLLCGRLKSLDAQRAQLETPLAGTVAVPAGLIAALWSEGAALTPLATLAPKVRQVAWFDESWPLKTDRNLLGGFLVVAGRRAERGLACHSRCELAYTLDGGFSALVCEVGLDAAGGGRGEVAFQVFVDGKAAANVALRGNDAPRTIAVPLAGAKLLQLVVDPGVDGRGVGDHADWCWPVLVKGVAPAAQPQ
jgi:hypothetical protein